MAAGALSNKPVQIRWIRVLSSEMWQYQCSVELLLTKSDAYIAPASIQHLKRLRKGKFLPLLSVSLLNCLQGDCNQQHRCHRQYGNINE